MNRTDSVDRRSAPEVARPIPSCPPARSSVPPWANTSAAGRSPNTSATTRSTTVGSW